MAKWSSFQGCKAILVIKKKLINVIYHFNRRKDHKIVQTVTEKKKKDLTKFNTHL